MLKIALIGQVNVGKSTLFNRLIAEPKAIVSSVPGTTRDRNQGICSWQGRDFVVIDTGGIEQKKTKDEIEKGVRKQINEAFKEADVVFFLIEIRMPEDSPLGPPLSGFEREISRMIKKMKKTCFLILNKADSPQKRKWAESRAWLKLGFGKAHPISATTGAGVGDLLDEVITFVGVQPPQAGVEPQRGRTSLKVAIIGRPNVGKSTLLNALLGEERVIVSPFPHTTRGPQDILVYRRGKSFLLIDTAGIRQKKKIDTLLEKIGVQKSLRTIKKADVVLMVIDLSQTIGHQDKALLNLIIKSGKGLAVILNKCDLERAYQPRIGLANWAPSIFVSAKAGKNTEKIFSLIETVERNLSRRIAPDDLYNFLKQIIMNKGWKEEIWQKIYLRQTDVRPPRFVLKTPKIFLRRKLIPKAQINILEKELRKNWPFEGAPIIIKTLAI